MTSSIVHSPDVNPLKDSPGWRRRAIWCLWVICLWLPLQMGACGPLGPLQEPNGKPEQAAEVVSERIVAPDEAGLAEVNDAGLAEASENGDFRDAGGLDAGEDLAEVAFDASGRDAAIAERSRPPEAGPEFVPEGRIPLVAKAISLRASFLGGDLQSGLMERRGLAPGQWQLSLFVPVGTHSFSFVLDGKGSGFGAVGPLSNSGALIASQKALSLTTTKPSRIVFFVDLQQRLWRVSDDVARVPRFDVLRLSGSWSGRAQMLALTKQSDGLWTGRVTAKKGLMSFQFEAWQQGKRASRWGSPTKAHGAFPQGGALQVGGQCATLLPVDGEYQVSLWPHEQRWQIVAVEALGSGVAAWERHAKSLQSVVDPVRRTALTKQWLQRRRDLGAMPLRSGTEVLFLVEWGTRGPVSLAGSFNQWSTSVPMTQLVGTDFWYRKETLAPGHHEYKFVDASSPRNWILDPNNVAIVYGSLGPNSVIQIGQTTRHQLRWHRKVRATQLKNTRDIFVYLPPGYELGQQRYPVVYMHDGQNLFDPKAIFGGWDVANQMDQLIAQKKIRPAIIVGVANTPGRMSEYTHVQDRIGGQTTGGQAMQYADFLRNDLKPWIDGLYRTKPGYRTTATMGSSLGGLISLWLGYRYPDVFFRVGALSSTFGWGKLGASNQTMLELIQVAGWRDYVVYLDSGSPKDNYDVTIQMRDLFERAGYLHGLNLQHWTEQGAGHNEAQWRKRLFRPLTFLLHWP